MIFQREFLLVAACCRWPLTDEVLGSIRDAATGTLDWPTFMRIVSRQRVAGLVHNALSSAGVDVPPATGRRLAAEARHIARQSLAFAAETASLQRGFDASGIPVIVLKGVALAQRAYGSLALKQGRDIDLLVVSGNALQALRLLERQGYELVSPSRQLDDAQRRALVHYGREAELAKTGGNLRVELHWRPVDNSMLLRDIDACSATQDVALTNGDRIRTLATDDQFAYLCVHGASHSWARLKWLADLNALLAAENDDRIAQLYRHARDKGAGLCAGQALLLCQQLLALPLPAALAAELRANWRLAVLVRLALKAITGAEPHYGFGAITCGVLARFLLGQGAGFYLEQCGQMAVGKADAILLTLPRPLHFLYPLLRLPLWAWRRARSAGADGSGHAVKRNDPVRHHR